MRAAAQLPADDEEQRREHDAPEAQLWQAYCGGKVEHVPGDPEDKGTDQDRCDERQERNGDSAGDERAEADPFAARCGGRDS